MKMNKQKITATLEENYMPYAMSVILSRALPEIDGLKPSHRKLLYTMYKMNLIRGAKTKSANVVGQTMRLNPHGDQAIYTTMVRLTRGNESLLHPFVESKGNFGKVYSRDMQHAAARYTEVKLDALCNELFKDIDKDTVDFIDNYDGTMQEPKLLPVRFPNILANPNKGIAVGMASSIPSFNLEELCRATIEYMKDPAINLLDFLEGPDFPTGGKVIYDKESFEKIYETGSGSFKIRGKYEYFKKGNLIEITEIPYTTTAEAIIDKVIDLIKAGKLKEVSDIRDETDLKGLRITIDLKRGTDHELVMAKLLKETSLEDNFSCNFNLLVEGKPQVLGIKGILDAWVRFRMDSIRRGLQHDVQKFKDKLHLILGLKKVLLDIDRVIEIIRGTEKDDQVVPNLMEFFELDLVQAEYVANIKLRNINQEYILDRVSEAADLEERIASYEKIASSQREIKKIITHDLEEIGKKYRKDRKTEVVHEDEVLEISEETFIEDYGVTLFFTDHNYLKKVPHASLRMASNHKLKDDDEILQEIECQNDSELLLFTDQGNVYKYKTHELPDSKASELGFYIPNLIELEKDERVIHIIVTTSYEGHVLFAFRNGKVAKVPLQSYETKQNRKKLVNSYNTEAKLVRMLYLKGDVDLVVYRATPPDKESVMVLSSSLIPEKATRTTKGVQVTRKSKGAVMSNIELLTETKLKKPEQYRVDKIPMAGTNITPLNI